MDDEAFVARVIDAGSRGELERAGLIAASRDAERIARELAPLWDAPPLVVTEVRVNGARVDARMQSADGRAWMAVLWVDRSAPTSLARVSVYERPAAFAGTESGMVIVLNGPSSVGKSTLMAAFADAAPTPWACIDEPIFGRLPAAYSAWPATAGPVEAGFLAALAAAARAGNQFIVSAAGIAQARFRDALAGVQTVSVGLDAPLAVLIARELTQADKFGGLAEGSTGIHEGWDYDLRIDTATYRPEDAAALLSDFIARSER